MNTRSESVARAVSMKKKANFLTAKAALLLLGSCLFLGATSSAFGNAIFLTGDDPDYHWIGPNSQGAKDLLQVGIDYVMNPHRNSFAGSIDKFLFVQGATTSPGCCVDHVDGSLGLNSIGLVTGVNFDIATASNLTSSLGLLGTTYSAIVIGSDFGGTLTQAELNILNADSLGIMNFLNDGGGLFAMAESNSYVTGDPTSTGLTPGGGQFGFLPFVHSTYCGNPGALETGSSLTAYGSSLGLQTSDINGNYAHNCFGGSYGLNVVAYDATGHIVTLAGSGTVTPTGVVPEPASIFLLATGLSGIAAARKRRA